MRRLFEAAGPAIAAVTVASCATMTVSSHVQRGLDFSQYRTYDWSAADALPTGDPRLDQDFHFQDHLLGAVDRRLAARGFQRVTSGSPDLLIHFHANVTRRIDVNRIDQEKGYCADQGCEFEAVEYEAGTIVLDVVDRRTNRVIWRGWSQQNLQDLLGSGDRMERTVNEAVRRLLERFPGARANERPEAR